MTAMHLRWSFRSFEEKDADTKTDGRPKLSARISDQSRVETSWLATAIDSSVLRGAFGLGSTSSSRA